jgi:hypothetical protein
MASKKKKNCLSVHSLLNLLLYVALYVLIFFNRLSFSLLYLLQKKKNYLLRILKLVLLVMMCLFYRA